MEILSFLIGMLCVLFLVTIIGHGIWTLIAKIFGSVSGQRPKVDSIRAVESPSAESDIQLTYAAIDRMFRAGLIDRDSFETLAVNIQTAASKLRVDLPPIIAKLRGGDAEFASDLDKAQPTTAERMSIQNSVEQPSHFALDSQPPVIQPKLELSPIAPVHALDRDYEPEPPSMAKEISKQSHRALGDVLQQFLSEKNIQWGELLSALLIVGSAIGLILSLRTQLNQLIPMFPAVLFFLVTVAIHLAGFYTLKKWKLPSTSRGLLVLGSLMMTITALATSLLSKSDTSQSLTSVSFLAPAIVGGIGFAILAYYSGRSLFPSQPILWSLSLVVGSLIPGIVNRFAATTLGTWEFSWLSILAMTGVTIATASLMPASFRSPPINEKYPALGSQLRLFGIALFGTIVSVGLLLFRTKSQLNTALPFAIPASFAGAVLMCAGGHFGRQWKLWRVVKSPADHPRLLDSVIMLSTSLSMLGGTLFLMALALAQSNSDIFLAASIVNCVLAIGLAVMWNQPALTAMATLFGSIGVWLLAHRWQGIAPDSAISGEWIAKAIPTVVSSATSMVLAVVTGALGLVLFKQFPTKNLPLPSSNLDGNSSTAQQRVAVTGVSHSMSLLVASALHSLIAFAIAGYLGASSKGQPELIFSIASMSLIAIGAMIAGRFLANELVLVTGSIFIAFALAIFGRTDTDLARALGIDNWKISSSLILVCLMHAGIVLIAIQALRFVPLQKKNNSPRNFFQSFGRTGILTALIPILFLINWDLGLGWSWHALWLAAISAILLIHWLIGRQEMLKLQNVSLPGTQVEFAKVEHTGEPKVLGIELTNFVKEWSKELHLIQFLAFVSTAMASCFVLAAALHQTPTLQSVPDLAFALGVALSVLAVAIIVSLAKRTRQLKKLEVLQSPMGDILFAAMGTYQMTHAWANWSDWSSAVRMGATDEASLWTSAFAALLFSVCLLAALRSRQIYIWLAGALSFVTTFMLLVMWFPNGRDVISLLTLMATAPIVIALGFAVWDTRLFLRNREVYAAAPEPASYEIFLGNVTIVLWGLLTTLCLFFGAVEPSEKVYGLLSGTGLLWFLLGMILFALRSLIENGLRFVVLFQLGSLLVFLHLPILLMRAFNITFGLETYLALLVVGASLHTMSLVWFSVQGHRLARAILTSAQIAPARSPDGTLELSRTHAVLISNLILALSVIYVAFVNQSDAIRLMALAVAMIGFALLGLDKFMVNPIRWTATIRSMVIAAAGMFVIYFVWSGVTQTEWSDVWVSRILRVTSVFLVANMILCGIYVWITGSLASEESDERNLPHPNLAIHLSQWLSFSRQNRLGSWADTVTQHWHVSSLLTLVLIVAGMICMIATHNEAASGEGGAVRKLFSTETLWVVSLSVIWIVQLIVQAVRIRWNVAQFFLKMRSTYVYLGEVVFCLTAMQLYLVHPEWFRFPMREYWPIILLFVAVIGQGIAQLLKRTGVETVGEPLANTSLILPIAASVGMMVFATESKPDVVMALGGLFYFFMGATEGSRQLAMVGGVFANAALLLFWKRFDGLDFSAHPQLWLIPPAASIAIATHFESGRLNAETKSWVRYLAMATIFLSSSSEILLQGLGKELWPPMVLMVLSVATIFLGISFQVRSYLYSGLIFTLLALIAMVAHAQQSLQHTWPWWALGISLGIGILVLFGLFEKKREQFNKVAERLKAWNG